LIFGTARNFLKNDFSIITESVSNLISLHEVKIKTTGKYFTDEEITRLFGWVHKSKGLRVFISNINFEGVSAKVLERLTRMAPNLTHLIEIRIKIPWWAEEYKHYRTAMLDIQDQFRAKFWK